MRTSRGDQAFHGSDADRRKALVRARHEGLDLVKHSGQLVTHKGVELDGQVDHVLQAVGAGVVEPHVGVLVTRAVKREKVDVFYLHAVEDGEQHVFEDLHTREG